MFFDTDFDPEEEELLSSEPLQSVDYDASQLFHSEQLNANQQSDNSPPPQVDPNDTSIAFSTSIAQSRDFISLHLGVPVSRLHANNVPGLVILRLSDFSVLRNDQRFQRQIPHFLVVPNENFRVVHPDLSQFMDFFAQ